MKLKKYNPGDKFIIEVAEMYDRTPTKYNERPDYLYRMRHFDSLVMTESALDKLARVNDSKEAKDTMVIVNTMQKLADLNNILAQKRLEVERKLFKYNGFDDADLNYIKGIEYAQLHIDKMVRQLKEEGGFYDHD